MKKAVKRAAIFVAGWMLVGVGLLLSIPGIPGPGLLIALIGLLVLASEFVWAHNLLQRLRARFPRLSRHVDDARQRAHAWFRRSFGRASRAAARD